MCKEVLSLNSDHFRKNSHPDRAGAAQWSYACKPCLKEYKKLHKSKQKFKPLSVERLLLVMARERASKKGMPFTLTLEDIIIPNECPLLKIPLFRDPTKKGPCANSPTIDRIDNSKGYTKDNIWIVSYKANAIKNNATLCELIKLTENLSRVCKC